MIGLEVLAVAISSTIPIIIKNKNINAPYCNIRTDKITSQSINFMIVVTGRHLLYLLLLLLLVLLIRIRIHIEKAAVVLPVKDFHPYLHS